MYKSILLSICRCLPSWTTIDIAHGPLEEYEKMLDIISKYNVVFTDFAHVAISSAMMGKKTYFWSTAYHKNKGIYEYSLHNLPNIKWMG